MSLLVSQCGHQAAFDDLFLKNALGRRFSTTVNGRMGMTAYEQLLETDRDVRDEPDRPILEFAGLTNDPVADMMMNGFRDFLTQRDPRAAELIGGYMDHRERSRGVNEGDVVVALVGGFHLYGKSFLSSSLHL